MPTNTTEKQSLLSYFIPSQKQVEQKAQRALEQTNFLDFTLALVLPPPEIPHHENKNTQPSSLEANPAQLEQTKNIFRTYEYNSAEDDFCEKLAEIRREAQRRHQQDIDVNELPSKKNPVNQPITGEHIIMPASRGRTSSLPTEVQADMYHAVDQMIKNSETIRKTNQKKETELISRMYTYWRARNPHIDLQTMTRPITEDDKASQYVDTYQSEKISKKNRKHNVHDGTESFHHPFLPMN